MRYEHPHSPNADFMEHVENFSSAIGLLHKQAASFLSILLIGLGASGIFLKHDPPNLLAKSIREVLDGRIWLPQLLFKDLF